MEHFGFFSKSVVLKKLRRNTDSDFPAGAVFCPPSCPGKQHMCLRGSRGESVGLENIPMPRGERRGVPGGVELSLGKSVGRKKDWGKGTQTSGRWCRLNPQTMSDAHCGDTERMSEERDSYYYCC